MTHDNIAAPLAAALAERGYENLTAVQQAMLNPEAPGRDLLVSAQTGSGKTVAFGIAAASDVLNPDGTLPQGNAPLALVVAPTRELALQVAAELGWLYVATGAQIATCVGGMDYRTERRALARAPAIVVGTPGRLRDHIERGSLDLAELRVAVLDEADEMLDLGFREDLEFILQSAPEARRTLMFSATVPPAIEKLARDFQRDALRLATQGEARQHGDITYRALSVAVRDRENAILNLLRFYEARTAIVFVKTRAEVNHLLARMANRGLRVVALSGELSQQERTHALQALRDGRAQVCIATDVAARGIDLPGLELVIHADLPTNSETLLHRSGRTGRAGAKGVSALIVPPSAQKKAQRLLQGAKVVAEWGNAPTAEEVSARDDVRMMDHPALSTALDDMAIAHDLLAKVGPEQVAAAFVQLWREGRPAPEEITEVAARPDSAPRPAREFGPSVWFELSVGHSGRAEARWLLPKICEAGGITRNSIGAIRVREHESFVQIATADEAKFGEAIEIEPGLMMLRMKGEPVLERPADGKRPVGAPRKSAARPMRTPREPEARPRPMRDAPAPEAAPQDKRAASGPKPARAKTAGKPAPKWSPVDEVPRQDAPRQEGRQGDGDLPTKKPRWKKSPDGPKGKSATAKYARTGASGGKPAAKAGAKPGSKTAGKTYAPKKPGAKGTSATRGPRGGSAPPRRPKG